MKPLLKLESVSHNIIHVALSTVISYHNHDINVSTQEIEAFAIHFLHENSENQLLSYRKSNW